MVLTVYVLYWVQNFSVNLHIYWLLKRTVINTKQLKGWYYPSSFDLLQGTRAYFHLKFHSMLFSKFNNAENVIHPQNSVMARDSVSFVNKSGSAEQSRFFLWWYAEFVACVSAATCDQRNIIWATVDLRLVIQTNVGLAVSTQKLAVDDKINAVVSANSKRKS